MLTVSSSLARKRERPSSLSSRPPRTEKEKTVAKREGFKLLHGHRKGCRAARRPPAFILHDGNDFSRDRLGRRNGSKLWHRFRCNDTECEAIMLVRWDVLADFVDDSEPPDA
jgi:hypothetical protein